VFEKEKGNKESIRKSTDWAHSLYLPQYRSLHGQFIVFNKKTFSKKRGFELVEEKWEICV